MRNAKYGMQKNHLEVHLMNKCKITVWGREFEIPVFCRKPEDEVLLTQLTENEKEIDKSLTELRKYIVQSSEGQVTEKDLDNIFRYVMPQSVFIPHISGKCLTSLLCNYKLDIEHGLAIVFEDGKFKEIGAQDIIL